MTADLPGLSVNRVSVTYRNGHTALRDATFSVPRGSIAALVGINGSGKSTLFKALMGFVRLSHGEIAILGQPVHRALRQNLVAYVPQSEDVDWDLPGTGGGCRHDGPLRTYGLAATGQSP